MRILLLTPMPPAPSAPGAIPVLLHAEFTGLAAHHDVTLVTVAGPEEHEIEAVRSLEDQGVDVHAVIRHKPHGLRWLARRRLKGAAWIRHAWPIRTVWYWEPTVQAVVDELAARRAFDVILAEDNATGVYDLPAGPLKVLTEHEVRRPRHLARPPGSPMAWPSWAAREFDWARWYRFQRSVWRRFDLLQVFSQRDAEAIGSIAPDLASRVHVNPFAVALPEASSPLVETGTVLFLGNFTHPPNVDAALWLAGSVMPELRLLRPGAKLVLAGAHPPAEVSRLAAPDIAVPGFVPDADALMRRSEVVVAPMRIGGGMRMKVLQAMGLGKPVVTTDRGAEGLMGPPEGRPVAIANDARTIAGEIAGLMADPSQRDALGAAAGRFVAEHHSPDAYAARFEAIVADECRRRLSATVP
jgi:glycosyltransferase involved in cell wall biosynthesis